MFIRIMTMLRIVMLVDSVDESRKCMLISMVDDKHNCELRDREAN